jgi:hypothetical protein
LQGLQLRIHLYLALKLLICSFIKSNPLYNSW